MIIAHNKFVGGPCESHIDPVGLQCYSRAAIKSGPCETNLRLANEIKVHRVRVFRN